MIEIGIVVSFLVRCSLVALFLPFSALDKLLNHDACVKDAQATVHSKTLAKGFMRSCRQRQTCSQLPNQACCFVCGIALLRMRRLPHQANPSIPRG